MLLFNDLFGSPQVLLDDLDAEDVESGLVNLLHRQEVSLSECWLVFMLLRNCRNHIQLKGIMHRMTELPPPAGCRC